MANPKKIAENDPASSADAAAAVATTSAAQAAAAPAVLRAADGLRRALQQPVYEGAQLRVYDAAVAAVVVANAVFMALFQPTLPITSPRNTRVVYAGGCQGCARPLFCPVPSHVPLPSTDTTPPDFCLHMIFNNLPIRQEYFFTALFTLELVLLAACAGGPGRFLLRAQQQGAGGAARAGRSAVSAKASSAAAAAAAAAGGGGAAADVPLQRRGMGDAASAARAAVAAGRGAAGVDDDLEAPSAAGPSDPFLHRDSLVSLALHSMPAAANADGDACNRHAAATLPAGGANANGVSKAEAEATTEGQVSVTLGGRARGGGLLWWWRRLSSWASDAAGRLDEANLLTLALAALGYTIFVPYAPGSVALRGLRSLRALRLLRLVAVFPPLRKLSLHLKKAAPGLRSAVVMTLIFIVFFSIVGMDVFRDVYHRACAAAAGDGALEVSPGEDRDMFGCGYRQCPAGYDCQVGRPLLLGVVCYCRVCLCAAPLPLCMPPVATCT